MKRATSWLAALACIGLPVLASADGAADKAIRTRQSAYYLMEQQMLRISAVLKGNAPMDKTTLETSAEAVDLIGHLVVDYFPAGSDQGNTKARPDVWKEAPRFKQLAQALHAETAKLKAAVHGGDLEAIKAAYGATAKSCKACHDSYRAQ